MQIGNLFKHHTYYFVATELQPIFCILEYSGYDFTAKPYEVRYSKEVKMYDKLEPVEMWDSSNGIAHYVMNLFDFERRPHGVYVKEVNGLIIEVKDCFFFNECVLFSATKGEKNVLTVPVWFAHELQNAYELATGQRLLSEVGKKILIDTKKLID